MEPLDDEQLKEVLREWQAPKTPAHVEARVFARPAPRWKWLLTGSVRIPVPVLLLALIAVAGILYSARGYATRPAEPPAGLANFQPVKELNLRVIRSNYEQR